MDGDPGVEPEVDSFSLVLPLPFRVAIILVLGVWAWALNLHYLHAVRIDVPSLIRYPQRPSQHHASHHHSTYRLATFISIPLVVCLLIFWILTHGNRTAVLGWQSIPQLYLIFLILCFAFPLHRLSKSGRSRFVQTLRRISIGGLLKHKMGSLGDILLADALTSYAKVLGDWFVSTCMMLSSKTASTAKPNRGCGGAYIVPIIISIPSRTPLPGSGWGGQHLANALKYSTAFPVIFLSALQRGYDPKSFYMTEAGLFRLWLLAVFVNSFYSFYWDVAKDWDLTLFSSSRERNNSEHPYGLRRNRYFHSYNMYYLAIVIDFCLRCTWSFKLSPHLDHFNDLEGGIFLMEFLEVWRRWMWIFFRVEAEWVRTTRGPAPDDILLGEFGKIDDD